MMPVITRLALFSSNSFARSVNLAMDSTSKLKLDSFFSKIARLFNA